MKSPVIALQLKQGKAKGDVALLPSDHPAFAGKEFTSVNEALQSIADYRETSKDVSQVTGVIFFQIFDL